MEKAELTRLVRALQNGESEAAGQLYDAFQPDIYYFIKKTVQDPTLAEDLTQDTFMEILQTIDKLQEPAAFVTWSRQIAYHRCTAHFRKRTELLADESEDGYSVFDTIEEDRTEFLPDEALDKADLQKTIHEMIDALSEEQRSAIMMRYFDELPVKQIAQIQGVSEGTVKSRLNYGRKAIQ
jgi:RNA polymerase sigma factor (sigma-70 family)